MSNESASQLFARFRERGDSAALAELFDRTAPRLLLLAMHWTGDAHVAEDLVQQTFLEAMQNANRFDAARAVEPWLAGVLGNLTKRHRRRHQRSRAIDGDVVDALPGVSRDPAGILEDADTLATVTKAIDAVPAAYRDALILNVVHGLRAIDIAHSLGRSPATVRSQLKRGAEYLRGLLPKSLVTPVIAAICAGEGLTQVRTNVLKAASGHTAVAAATAPFWIWILLPAVALGLVALAWRLVFPNTRPVADPASSVAQPLEAGAVPGGPPASKLAPTSVAEREPRPASTNRTAIVGKCVAMESNTPLAKCSVHVFDSASPYVGRKLGTGKWRAQTGSDGAFAIEVGAAVSAGIVVVTADGRAPMSLRVAVKKAESRDVGTIALPRGTRVHGRVTEPDGTPVSDVHVYLHRVAPLGTHEAQPPRSVGLDTFSGSDGTFEFPNLLAPGEYMLMPNVGGRRISNAPMLVVASNPVRRSMRFDLTTAKLDRTQLITGRVVDSAGKPVPHLKLWARIGDKASRVIDVTKDGRFTVVRRADDTDEVSIRCAPRGGSEGHAGWKILGPPIRAKWGIRDLRVPLQRPTSNAGKFVLRVVREQDGSPVTRFGIRFYSERLQGRKYNGNGPVGRRILHEGLHPKGELVLTDVVPTLFKLAVYPEDEGLQFTDFESVRVGNRPHVVVVKRKRRLRVEVSDDLGRPVSGTHVELIRRPRPQEVRMDVFVHPVSPPPDIPALHVLVAARTDEAGVVWVDAAPARHPYALRVFGPGHGGKVVQEVRADRQQKLVVRVERGATLTGRLVPRSAFDKLWSKEVNRGIDPDIRVGNHERGIVWPVGPRAPARISKDGTFELDGIPPGDWQVLLTYTDPITKLRGATRLPPVVRLTNGTRREVRVHLPTFDTGTLGGTVHWNGEPYRNATVQVVPTDPEKGAPITVKTGSNGELAATTVKVGRYRVVEVPKDFGVMVTQSRNTIEVRADQVSSARFDLWSTSAQVQFVAADGETPVSNVRCRRGYRTSAAARKIVPGREYSWGFHVYTPDSDGRLDLPRVRDAFYLEVVDASQRSRVLGPFRVPERKASFTLKVRLP